MATPAPSTGRPARFGPVGVAQLVAVEIVAATLLFVKGADWIWLAAAVAVTGVAVFGRTRGLLWYVRGARWLRLVFRRRRDRRKPAEVAALAAGIELSTVTERGMSLGVAFDGTGWFAGLTVDSDEPPHLAFGVLSGILLGSGAPVSSVQLVTQTVPLTSSTLPRAEPEADEEDDTDGIKPEWRFPGDDVTTTQVMNGLPLFARRDAWFVVRLDVQGASRIAAERGGGAVGIQRALGGTVGRLMKGAKQVGVNLRPLDATGLDEAVRQSLGAESAAVETADKVAEDWRTWSLGDLDQVTFTLHGKLPGAEELRRLWTEVAELQSAFCAVSISMRRASDRPVEKRLSVRCLIRVAAGHEDIDGLVEELTKLAVDNSVKLRRCNGRQGPAAYASAASGGIF
ncbi:type VII secretion protein EccE [Phytomonospora sp. NPDC050363]|uniref:type VII secretion protein EccE n=1 Tax=Phytomonospora sp. NPDC050363 TaxID=3155642 RepID=UPI0033D74ECF